MTKIIKFIHNNKVSILLSIVYILVYVVNIYVGDNRVFQSLSGSGFKKLNGEVYRLFTASFLHGSLVHLVGNIVALICVGNFLEKRLGWLKMFLVYVLSDILASLLFYGYMSECTGGNGSSIAIYALFAVFLVLWLRYPDEFMLSKYNPALIYIVLYFFIASFFSGCYTTIIIHAFSFVVGLSIGIVLVSRKLFIKE